MNHTVEEAIGGYEDKVAAQSVMTLSNDIKRVLELGADIQRGEWHSGVANIPLMASIIRQQQELLREAYKSVLVYYQNYMMDEADSAENCVCGEKQHKDAIAVADVLVKIKTALGDV